MAQPVGQPYYTNRYYFRHQEVPFKVSAFTGLNTYIDETRIADTEATELINLDLNPGGELTKRPPTHLSGTYTPGGKLFGLFNVASVGSVFIASSNANLYKSSDGLTWTLIGATPNINNNSQAIQYVDKVYFSTFSGVYVYDGVTVSLIVGSPSSQFITVFRDRLFVTGATMASRLYFSDSLDPTTWTGTNFIDVSAGDGDELSGLYPLHDKLLIFKNKSIWSLYVQGSPIAWIMRLSIQNVGAFSGDTIVEIENIIYFVSYNGVYRTDGTDFICISDPIANILLALVPEANFLYCARFRDKYVLSISTGANISNIYIFYPKLGGWSRWELTLNSRILYLQYCKRLGSGTSFDRLYFVDSPLGAGSVRLLYINDNLLTLNEICLDEGNLDYPIKYISKIFDYSLEGNFKRGKQFNLFVDADVEDIIDTINITYETEEHTEIFNLDQIDSGRYPYKIKGPGYFRHIKYTIEALKANRFKLFAYEVKVNLKSTFQDSGAP